MASTVTGILVVTLVLLAGSWFLLPLYWARLLLWAGRKWAGLQQRQLEVGGSHWTYLEGGKGPLLVLLHGFGADGDNWLQVAPALAKEFRIIAPDLPGFGRSTADERAFDIDSQVRRLHAFLQALGETPAIMAGNSMGGWITASYASIHPGGLKAIWLLAPLGVRDAKVSPMLRSIENMERSPFQVENIAQFRAQVLKPMFAKLPWFPFPLQAHYTREAIKFSRVAPEMFGQVLASPRSLESIAEEIDIPVLLQWGALDLAVDVSGSEPLKSAFQQVMVRVQEHTGHVPMLETPKDSVGFFRDFCAKYGVP